MDQLNKQLIPILKEHIKTLEKQLKESSAVNMEVLRSSFMQFLNTLPPLKGESRTIKLVLMNLLQLKASRPHTAR